MNKYGHFFNLFTFLFIAILFFQNKVSAQINIGTTMTPTQLVQNVLVGAGVTVSNVTFSGGPNTYGDFSNGNLTNLGLTSGVALCTGTITDIPNPVSFFTSNSLGLPGDPDLNTLTTNSSQDATILAFDFNPIGDTLKFRYVFGSEEYPEYVCSQFNDVFGFFVTGPNPLGGNYNSQNIALIPGTALPVAINTVNPGVPGANSGGGTCTSLAYSSYFIDNEALGGTTIVYDGFTTVFTAWIKVVPCQQYHIKIGIADVGDGAFDSGVFLEANSFSSNGVNINHAVTSPNIGTTAVEGCNDEIISFILTSPADTTTIIHYTVGGTAINGTDYVTITDSITFLTGEDSTAIIISPFLDGLTEGLESIIFTFQITVCGAMLSDTVYILDNTPLVLNPCADTSICNGQSANISVTQTGGIAPYSYSWSSGAGTDSTEVVSPTNSITYVVTVSDLCSNINIDSVHVNVFNMNTNTISTNPLCFGGNDGTGAISVTGNSGTLVYLWSPSGGNDSTAIGLSDGTYIISVTDALGCIGLDTVTIVNPPLLVANIIDSTDVLCNGSSTGSATVNAIGGTGLLTYVWSPAGGTNSSANNLPAGTYNVTVTDANGCAKTESITIDEPTVLVLNSTPTNEHCLNSCDGTALINAIGGVPGYTYSWNTTPVQDSTLALNLCVGNYIVTVTDANGCSKTESASITTSTLLNADANASAVWGIIPFNVDFTFTGYGSSNYLWDFGDGSTYILTQNASHTYANSGVYEVTLIISSGAPDFCTDSVKITITVEFPSTLEIPNVFTPNGDGKNDFFNAKSSGLESLEVKVYNRWGKLMAEWNTIDIGWNGMNKNGSEASDGVYFYILTAHGRDGIDYNDHGSVTLIR